MPAAAGTSAEHVLTHVMFCPARFCQTPGSKPIVRTTHTICSCCHRHVHAVDGQHEQVHCMCNFKLTASSEAQQRSISCCNQQILLPRSFWPGKGKHGAPESTATCV